MHIDYNRKYDFYLKIQSGRQIAKTGVTYKKMPWHATYTRRDSFGQ